MGAARLLFLCRELEVGAMAQRGRKPKPTALKMLEGNPGGRPLNTKDQGQRRRLHAALPGWKMRRKKSGNAWRKCWNRWDF